VCRISEKNRLLRDLSELRKTFVRKTVETRLKEFKFLGKKGEEEWFCELCFCILTANSKAVTALSIQDELGASGFICDSEKSVCDCIKKNKHRFHNNKAKYIVEARKYKSEVKKKVNELGEIEAREWLVKNIKGLGYKEASHFLRNVGYVNLAILDRHILNLMVEEKVIKEKPKTLNKKKYLEIESKFKEIADKLSMNAAELDLYMWYMKTGKVLK